MIYADSSANGLADAGVALRDLQKIMRHTRIETTEQNYLRDNAVEIGQRLLSVPEKTGTLDGSWFG